MNKIGKLILINGVTREEHTRLHLGWVPDYDECIKATGASKKFVEFWRRTYKERCEEGMPREEVFKLVVMAFISSRKRKRSIKKLSKSTTVPESTLAAWIGEQQPLCRH